MRKAEERRHELHRRLRVSTAVRGRLVCEVMHDPESRGFKHAAFREGRFAGWVQSPRPDADAIRGAEGQRVVGKEALRIDGHGHRHVETLARRSTQGHAPREHSLRARARSSSQPGGRSMRGFHDDRWPALSRHDVHFPNWRSATPRGDGGGAFSDG